MRIYNLSINGNDYEVTIKEVTEDDIKVEVNGVEHIVSINKITNVSEQGVFANDKLVEKKNITPQFFEEISDINSSAKSDSNAICSPLPGHVLDISVQEGEKVLAGQKLLVIEAMKLENIITADMAGTVKKILVSVGDVVNHDQALITLS